MTNPEDQIEETFAIYATVDGYVTSNGYGYYNRDARIHRCEDLDDAQAWVARHAPPGQKLDHLVATNRSDHPLGWFSLAGNPDDAHTIAAAIMKGFLADIHIAIHRPGAHTDFENTWVSFDDPIYVPKWCGG